MAILSPCPFCGGKAEIVEKTKWDCFGDRLVTLSVRCTRCGAEPYWADVVVRRGAKFDTEKSQIQMEITYKWEKRTDAGDRQNGLAKE